MQMIIIMVAAVTMACDQSGPSPVWRQFVSKHSQNHANGRSNRADSVQMAPILTSSNHDDRRLAYSKQVGGRVLHTDATGYREARWTQFRVLCTSGRLSQTANHVCIRSHPETDAIHTPEKRAIWFGHM